MVDRGRGDGREHVATARDGGSRTHGREPRAPRDARRASVRRHGRQPGRDPLARGRGHDGRGLGRRARARPRAAAHGLGDGARGDDHRAGNRRARHAPRAGRHGDRRRQHPLPRRHPQGRGAGRSGDPLPRRRHERRGVRTRAGLLPDDRRRGRDRGAAGPTLHLSCARAGRRRAHSRPHGRSGPGGARLAPLRPGRGGALREDGAQRHRVRPDGRLRRGPEHPPPRQRGRRPTARRTPRPRRSTIPSCTATTSTSPRSQRCGGAAASSPPGSST